MLFAAHTAQAISPMKEAKTKEWLELMVPVIKTAFACKWDDRHEYLETAMNTAYLKAGATDEVDKMLVDMMYQNAEMQFEWGSSAIAKFVKLAKAHPNRPEIKTYCDQYFDIIKDSI